MKKLLDTLLTFIWVIDILNIGISVLGFDVIEFLDITMPINTLGWLLIWIFV